MPDPQLPQLTILPEWEKFDIGDVDGIQMVIGAPDAGKSTFARYLYRKYSLNGQKTAFLDGDPGQSLLGPPTTITLVIGEAGETTFPPRRPGWRKFIGSTSPTGHLLPTVIGAKRLCEQAQEAGAQGIIFDTSGLVDPRLGGLALKYADLDLLQPRRVYAIQREKELEPLLSIIRRSQRCELVQLKPAEAVIVRSMESRQAHRAQQFAEYFRQASLQRLKWIRYGIYPAPRFALEGLVALEDQQGFTLALGIVMEIDRENRQVTLLTPPVDLERVKILNLGDMLVHPHTFQDKRME